MKTPAALVAAAIAAFVVQPAGSTGGGSHLLAVGYASPAALTAALRRHPAQEVESIAPLRVAEVRVTGDPAVYARELISSAGIRFVEPTGARRSLGEPALAVSPGGMPYEWQYAATREDDVPAAVARAAAGITIAVVDTGADLSAPDLAAKHPQTWSEVTDTTAVRDTSGHGTFVASLAAGSPTNGDGMAGAGGDAQLMVVQASRDGESFTDLDEANAIVWAVDHGARIVNLSLGGSTTSHTERAAIDYAVAHGALLVAAAGNEHAFGNAVQYPAALLQPPASDGVGGRGLSVGASDPAGRRASFSNTGGYVSLVAPGTSVLGAVSSLSSTARFPRLGLPGTEAGLYGLGSGTSYAAPQVAGAAALVWAADPALTAGQVAQVIKDSASNGGRWNPDTGWGVLDAAAAVDRAARLGSGSALAGRRR